MSRHGRAVVASLIVVAACGTRGSQPADEPQNRFSAAALQLPDDACLRLGIERYPDDQPRHGPGRCRLRAEQHPPTGIWCIAALHDLGGESLEFRGCYRREGTNFTLDFATLDKAQAQILVEFDGKQCWVLDTRAWSTVTDAVKALVSATTGCASFRDDVVF